MYCPLHLPIPQMASLYHYLNKPVCYTYRTHRIFAFFTIIYNYSLYSVDMDTLNIFQFGIYVNIYVKYILSHEIFYHKLLSLNLI